MARGSSTCARSPDARLILAPVLFDFLTESWRQFRSRARSSPSLREGLFGHGHVTSATSAKRAWRGIGSAKSRSELAGFV
jgi:hypothetical protein